MRLLVPWRELQKILSGIFNVSSLAPFNKCHRDTTFMVGNKSGCQPVRWVWCDYTIEGKGDSKTINISPVKFSSSEFRWQSFNANIALSGTGIQAEQMVIRRWWAGYGWVKAWWSSYSFNSLNLQIRILTQSWANRVRPYAWNWAPSLSCCSITIHVENTGTEVWNTGFVQLEN